MENKYKTSQIAKIIGNVEATVKSHYRGIDGNELVTHLKELSFRAEIKLVEKIIVENK